MKQFAPDWCEAGSTLGPLIVVHKMTSVILLKDRSNSAPAVWSVLIVAGTYSMDWFDSPSVKMYWNMRRLNGNVPKNYTNGGKQNAAEVIAVVEAFVLPLQPPASWGKTIRSQLQCHGLSLPRWLLLVPWRISSHQSWITAEKTQLQLRAAQSTGRRESFSSSLFFTYLRRWIGERRASVHLLSSDRQSQRDRANSLIIVYSRLTFLPPSWHETQQLKCN